MNKISSIAQSGRSGKAIADRPTDDLVMALAAPKGLNLGRKSNLQDAPENQAPAKDGIVLGELATGDHSIDLGTESASSLPALFDTPAESFATLAQAPAATATPDGRPAAVFFESASATQIGAVALGVIAVAAAASGGGSSGGGSSSPKVVPAPTVSVADTTGVITVTLGGDSASAKLFDGTTDITSRFTSAKSGQVVTFTPVGQFDGTKLSITAKAADSAGLSSSNSAPIEYRFDNVPPAAPTVTAAVATGVITVELKTTSDAKTAKLFAGSTDVTGKFTSVSSGSTVTYTPIAGQTDIDTPSLTATVADLANNVSAASTAITYKTDLVPPAPPTVTTVGATGVITVELAATSDATTAKLFAGGADVTSNFTAVVSGSKITYTPIAGKVELTSQALTATAADAAKNVSAASAAVTYTFDNAIDINASNASTLALMTAAGADYQFTFAEGTYAASLDGFGLGDKLVFVGELVAPEVSIVNTSSADGKVALIASYPSFKAVDLNLTGLNPASDAKILGVDSFKTEFGNASLSTVSGTSPQPTTSVTIDAATSANEFDAAGANVAYKISEGTYSSVIKGFGVGDSIKFSGQDDADLTLVNAFGTDGLVKITGNFGAKVVDLTVAGLTPAQDGGILGVNSFKSVFGSVSLTTEAVAPSSAKSESISASNASGEFSAAGGDVAYSLGEGTYKTSISGFGLGDSLSFFPSKVASLTVVNTSGTDGVVLITGEVGGQVVDVTLTALLSTLDQQVLGVNSFNLAFGTGSLIA